MKPLTTLLAIVFVFLGVFGVGIANMMLGWGVAPRSWGWIVGMFFAHMALYGMMRCLAKEDKKDV